MEKDSVIWGYPRETKEVAQWLTFIVAQTAAPPGGVSETTFLVVVTALAGAVSGLAAYLHRRVEKENRELKDRLKAYEDVAPQFIAAVKLVMEPQSRPSSPVSRSRPTRPSVSRSVSRVSESRGRRAVH